MGMIIKTRKRRWPKCSKQVNLKSINTHKRVNNPELYSLLRNKPELLLNLN
jgi:hypothetical protein